VEIKKANLYAVFTAAILCGFSNAAGRKGAVEHPFRVVANRTLHGPETGLWEVSYELVQQLVTGRGVDLGWSRLSHFHRGVVFRNPVFNFNVKLFCLDDDLFCFCVGRNIGESVVDSISLPSTRLKIVGVLVRGFTQHQFRALQGHEVVSDLAHDPIPRTGYGHIRSLSATL
jgi:hypothetical protein